MATSSTTAPKAAKKQIPSCRRPAAEPQAQRTKRSRRDRVLGTQLYPSRAKAARFGDPGWPECPETIGGAEKRVEEMMESPTSRMIQKSSPRRRGDARNDLGFPYECPKDLRPAPFTWAALDV